MSRAERVTPTVPPAPYYSRYTERKGSSGDFIVPNPGDRNKDSVSQKRKLFKASRNDSRNASRGTAPTAFHKHTVTFIAAAAAFKTVHVRAKKKSLTHSCPNLVSPFSAKDKEGNKSLRGSDSALQLIDKDRSPSPPASGNKLTVPVDIFTTSYTHSKPVKISSQPDNIRRSLQDLPDATKENDKLNLRRAISFTKDDPKYIKKGLHILPPSMYRDDQIAQITDYMFIGSIESAYNERRLCRLDIESLVDISNLNEMEIPSGRKPTCPCLCQTDFRHFRSRLIISVADDGGEQIDQYFDEVSRFIEGARRCGKKVLLYSYEGKSRSALFAMQYLMAYEGMLLRQAYKLVKKQRPCVALNPGFQKALEALEKTLFPDAKPSVNICNEYLNVADPQAIKCAWIDC